MGSISSGIYPYNTDMKNCDICGIFFSINTNNNGVYPLCQDIINKNNKTLSENKLNFNWLKSKIK